MNAWRYGIYLLVFTFDISLVLRAPMYYSLFIFLTVAKQILRQYSYICNKVDPTVIGYFTILLIIITFIYFCCFSFLTPPYCCKVYSYHLSL